MSVLTGRRTEPAVGLVLPRVNLLPPELMAGRRFRRVQVGLGAGVALTAGAVAVAVVLAGSSVSSAQQQLDDAQAQHAALQGQVGRYHDVSALYRRSADARAMLTEAMGQEVRYSRFLSDLPGALPDGVWLKTVTFSQTAPGAPAGTTGTPAAAGAAAPAGGAPGAGTGLGTVSLTGVAFAHTDVATWLEALAREKGYTGPMLQSSTEALLGTRKVVNWSVTVTLTPEALSGRYTRNGS